jgi:hypothetical protein
MIIIIITIYTIKNEIERERERVSERKIEGKILSTALYVCIYKKKEYHHHLNFALINFQRFAN